MTIEEIKEIIDAAAKIYPNAEVLFSADGAPLGTVVHTIDRANLEGEKRKLVLRSL